MPPPLRPTPTRGSSRSGRFASRPKTIAAFVALAAVAAFASYNYFKATWADDGVQDLPMPTLAPGESPWARVGETLAMTTYWDRSSASREGFIVRVWEIQDMRAPDPEGVVSRRYRAEYDCKHRMHRIGRMVSFDGPMLTGKQLFDVDEMGYWRQAPRGSVFGLSLALHCGMMPPAEAAAPEKEKAPWWAPFLGSK